MGSDGRLVAVAAAQSPPAQSPPAGSRLLTAGDVCRPATTVVEETSLPDAWRAVHADPDHHAVVLRGRCPVAVVTAERIAEAWPGGGPAVAARHRVADVLPRPLGVAAVEAGTDVAALARRMLDRDVATTSVVNDAGDLLGVVAWPDALRALLPPNPHAPQAGLAS